MVELTHFNIDTPILSFSPNAVLFGCQQKKHCGIIKLQQSQRTTRFQQSIVLQNLSSFGGCVVASFISALAFSRSFVNWIVIAWNACTHNASLVHFGNKIYICNIFRTCADDQTIRPCFQISKYTHSFYTVTIFRLLSLGYQNIIPIICTSAIVTAIQLHASNFNEPTHVERSDFFVMKLESNHEIRFGFRTNLIFIYTLRRMMSFTLIFKRYECVDIMWTLVIYSS